MSAVFSIIYLCISLGEVNPVTTSKKRRSLIRTFQLGWQTFFFEEPQAFFCFRLTCDRKLMRQNPFYFPSLALPVPAREKQRKAQWQENRKAFLSALHLSPITSKKTFLFIIASYDTNKWQTKLSVWNLNDSQPSLQKTDNQFSI